MKDFSRHCIAALRGQQFVCNGFVLTVRLRTIPIGGSVILVRMTAIPNQGPSSRIQFMITLRINARRQVNNDFF